jgi:hypothetical protein
MIDFHELTDKFFDSSAYYYTIGALTGLFIGTVGLYFRGEYHKFKEKEQNKSKDNLEETVTKK